MKTLIAFLFVAVTCSVFSQEAAAYKYSLGGYIAPGSSLIFSEHANAQEYFSVSAGFSASRKISKRLDFDTGLTFADRSQLLKNATYAANLDPQTGEFDTTFRILDRKQFVDIPLTLTLYSNFKGNWDLHLTGGICVGYVMKEIKTWTATPLGGSGIDNYRQIVNTDRSTCFRILAGAGFDYSFKNNVVLSVGTDYSFYYLPDSYKMLSDTRLIIGEVKIQLVKRF